MLPNLAPAIFAGAALAFARAVGEFGSLILIAKATQEVASIYIFKQVEGGNVTGAAAVSVVLLFISRHRPLRDQLPRPQDGEI